MINEENLIHRGQLSDIEFRAAVLAYMVYDQKLSSKEAVFKLNGDLYKSDAQSVAAADKKRAEKRSWITSQFRAELFAEDVLCEIKQKAHPSYGNLEQRLRRESGGIFRNMKVFYSGEEPHHADNVSWDKRLTDFGERVAGSLRELLANSGLVGVGWGQTLGLCIRGMEVRSHSQQSANGEQNQVKVFPTAGEPLGRVPDACSSSNLAIHLSALLNRSGGETLSLNDVPPIIPDEFRGEDREVVLRFIRHMRHYSEIFGDSSESGSSAIINRCDTLITSVGHFHQWTEFDTELLNVVEIDPEELTRLCKGDMGGALVEKGPLTGSDLDRFNEIQSSWTGASLTHYSRLARDSAESEKPGVIVCATGKDKSSVLYDLVTRKRVVNHLLICDSLAEALNLQCTAQA